MSNKNEIVLYQPNNSVRLDVRVENETLWLTQAQIADLFSVKVPAISKHLQNIYKSGELVETSTFSKMENMGNDGKQVYQTKYYNLDAILSVGYRVNSKNATLFRQWANSVLKDYILKGYAINSQIEQVKQLAIETERRVSETEKKIDFFVQKSLPALEGIFYDGQIFDAYKFVADLIKSAKDSIILIDNYVDENVLLLFSKRAEDVAATIYTKQISPQFQLDLKKHNEQYPPIMVKTFTRSHDRFLIIDDDLYHIGASLKDLGKKWFAFAKMKMKTNEILNNLG